jgi:hypothetical protein
MSLQDLMRRDEGVSPQGNLVAGVRWFMSKTVLAVLATGFLSCGLFCQQAGAVQISGSVIFGGTAMASGPSGTGTTTISFTNPGWTVLTGIGDYSSVTFGTPTTLNAFSFTGTGTGASLSGPVIPEWTFTFGTRTYSFDLLALVSGTTTSSTMAISGSGIAHITGFDDTPASWALEGSGENFTFNLSASTTTAVPDGGSAVSLLGIALVGLEALRRRLRSA